MQEIFSYRDSVRTGVYLLLFFAGVFFGIAIVQFQKDTAFAGIFSEYFLNQYAALKIDSGKLFGYVGRYRLGQYALVVCCGALSMAPMVFGILLFLLGMSWGSALSISTLRLGIKGVLICVVGVLPQIIFYLPAFGWVLLWVCQRGCSRKKYLFLTVVGLIFLLFGIASESCLNPVILQQLLRKMTTAA